MAVCDGSELALKQIARMIYAWGELSYFVFEIGLFILKGSQCPLAVEVDLNLHLFSSKGCVCGVR